MDKIRKASDCKCCKCNRKAVAFWPVIDPDIPSNPYCRTCLDKAKFWLILELQKNRNIEFHKSVRKKKL